MSPLFGNEDSNKSSFAWIEWTYYSFIATGSIFSIPNGIITV